MKLNVTKHACSGQLHSLYAVVMMMNDLSGCPVSCFFLISDGGS